MTAASLAPADSARPARAGWRPRLPAAANMLDVLLAGTLTLATFVVHNVSYLLSTPFWLDESWVAVSTRLPLRSAVHVTAVTPLGWTLLLRAAVVGGDQRLRMIPLIFSALTVLVGYLIARGLPWQRAWVGRIAGTLAGLAVLLAPSSLIRGDLKQYTADACVCLLILLLLSRLERSWSRARLAVLCAACVLGFLISAVCVFIALAALASLSLTCLIRRQFARLRDVLIFGAGTGLLLGGLFAALYLPHLGGDLTAYWRGYYLPVDKGIGPSLTYLHLGAQRMSANVGTGPLLLGLALVIGGVLTLALLGRPAVGYATPILLLEMIALGAAKKYPLFDTRTSHFLTVALAVLAAIGVAGLVSLLARRSVIVAVTVAALAAGLFVNHVQGDIRTRRIPAEDVRSPVGYLDAHRQPGDVIVVSLGASEGFGYYWPHGQPSWRKSQATGWHFQTYFPDQPDILVAGGRDLASLNAVMQQALSRAASHPGARVWILRTHLSVHERSLWHYVLLHGQLQARTAMPCSLLLLTAPPAGADTTQLDQAGYCG